MAELTESLTTWNLMRCGAADFGLLPRALLGLYVIVYLYKHQRVCLQQQTA